jgi:hypothetical protein
MWQIKFHTHTKQKEEYTGEIVLTLQTQWSTEVNNFIASFMEKRATKQQKQQQWLVKKEQTFCSTVTRKNLCSNSPSKICSSRILLKLSLSLSLFTKCATENRNIN